MQRYCERPISVDNILGIVPSFLKGTDVEVVLPDLLLAAVASNASRIEAAEPNLLDLDCFAMPFRWSPPVAWVGGLADPNSEKPNLPQDALSAVVTSTCKVMLPFAVFAALTLRSCAKGLEVGGRLTPWVVQPPMCSFAPPPKRPWHSLVPADAVRGAGVVRPLLLVAAIFLVACHAIVTALAFMVVGSALVRVAMLPFLGAKVCHSLIDIVT